MISRLQAQLAGMSTRNKALAAGVAGVVVVGLVVAVALTGGPDKKPVAVSPTTTAASPTPTPTPKAKPKPPATLKLNPLTGIGAPPAGPVFAVKIDDTENGRPPVGLEKADIVYIEQVEGGLTRLVAIFGTNKPIVEPVRSVRASDSELLAEYGKIALVASGGGGSSLPIMDASGLAGIINDRGGPGFSRDGGRPTPYNLQTNLGALARSVKAGGSRAVGFGWGARDPRVAAGRAARAINTVVGSTGVSFVWSPGMNKYERTVGGQTLRASSGAPIATPNVLVQLCTVTTDFGDVDVVGNPSHQTHTVGSGRVVLFRNGHRIEGRWSRPAKSAPTKYTDLKGKPLLLAPGGAYVVLATVGAHV